MEFDVGRSMHPHTIQVNLSTRCNSFTSLLLDVLFRSTSFGHLPTYHQELSTALSIEQNKTSSNKLVKLLHLVG
jgi:hypothetical protein